MPLNSISSYSTYVPCKLSGEVTFNEFLGMSILVVNNQNSVHHSETTDSDVHVILILKAVVK